MQRPFRFVTFAYGASSGSEWAETARRAEAQGYSALVMPDHFFNELTPVPALMAAAAVTTTLRIGAIVFANDYRHPALLAKEAATIDLLSDGRFEFGLGAGWLQKEYDQAGIRFDAAGVRIDRMIEGLQVIRGLWSDVPFNFTGEHYTITDMSGRPKPVQQPGPPIYMGGSGKRMLQVAAREADTVGLLPRNLPQGDHDWEGSTVELLKQQVGWVREAAGTRFAEIELSCVVFRAAVTDRAAKVAAQLGSAYGLSGAEVLASKDFLIGNAGSIAEQLLAQREQFGISHIEIDYRDADGFAPVVALLAGR